MSKRRIKCSDEECDAKITTPIVSNDDIVPKVKIYDSHGDYWFCKIGFNRKITDED